MGATSGFANAVFAQAVFLYTNREIFFIFNTQDVCVKIKHTVLMRNEF